MAAKPQGQKYRLPHDPYNNMERPDFLARETLSQAESDLPAIQKEAELVRHHSTPHRKHSATTRLRQSEENQQSTLTSKPFRNNVAGRTSLQLSRAEHKRLPHLKKLAPASIITILLAGGGLLFYFTQTMLPAHLSSAYTAATDIQYPSYISRNQRLFKYMMDGGNQLKMSNKLTMRYTSFTPYMKRRLAKNGIQVGYVDADGSFNSKQLIANNRTVLKYGDEIISADDFQTKFANDANFREAYTRAKRGRVAGFFDNSADNFMTEQSVTRNSLRNHHDTGNAEMDDANFREVVNNHVTGSDASVNSVHSRTGDEDEVGKNGDTIEASKLEGDTPEIKARTLINGLVSKVEKGTGVAKYACVGLRVANMAAVTVTAYQIFQSIAYFMSLSEPISKTIAVGGDSSATNAALNFFTRVTDSTVQYVDNDGKTRNETVTGSPLEADGAQLILVGTPVNQNKVAPYSLANIFGSAATVAGLYGASQATCDGVIASSAIVSLASNAMPGGTLAKFVVNAVANTVGGIAITAAVGAIVQTIIPYVARIFTNDIFERYHGIPGGHFFTQGGAATNFKLATQASAFMPASEEYVKEQNRKTTVVLAQEAEIDRLRRSPFDASSPNTFLGSLLSKLSFSVVGSKLGNGLAGFGTLVRNAFRKVFDPTASAADEEIAYTSSYGSCGNSTLNTVCDIYGNVIPARDYSTINLKPDDKKYNSVIGPNLDSDGKIIKNSELAKFISFCVERDSPWGVLDANIMNALQTDFGIVGNNLYLVEDAVDIINAAEDEANRPWGTGEICTMSKDNPRWDSEFKYYQAYVEDMRVLNEYEEGEDTASLNPVLAYSKEYKAEHPDDTSFEGTLARISGYTKDDISFLLEFTRYSSEIANYDYSNLFVFGKNQSEFVGEPENSETEIPQILSSIPYATNLFVDRRNYTV